MLEENAEENRPPADSALGEIGLSGCKINSGMKMDEGLWLKLMYTKKTE